MFAFLCFQIFKLCICVSKLITAVEIHPETFDNKKSLRQEIEGKLNYLVSARPTAVNMKIAADELMALANHLSKNDEISVDEMKQKYIFWCWAVIW